jgi:TRAP-type C4-dicarboxylate transport system permease small subunit
MDRSSRHFGSGGGGHMNTIYRAWRFLQDKILGYFAALILFSATILGVIEIIRRYLFGYTFYWGQDAVTYFLVGAAFLYFGVAQAQRTHLAVTVLPEKLVQSGRLRLGFAVRASASLLGLLFVAGFVWWGWPAAERTMMLGRMTESMVIPLWPFQFVLLFGMITMGVTLFFQFWREFILALTGRDPFPWDTSHEDFEL